MQQPSVKKQRIYVVLESVLESHSGPEEVHEYLRSHRFSGTAELTYNANYNQGGVRSFVTKEHIPITEKELDELLALRSGKNND
jgi:hypothetical protein